VLQATVEAPSNPPAAAPGNGSGGAGGSLQAKDRGSDSTGEAAAGAAKSDAAPAAAGSAGTEEAKHHARLLQLLADNLGIKSPDDIVDFELNVCDTQPGVIGGDSLICCPCENSWLTAHIVRDCDCSSIYTSK
jgi:hypothetical protein